MKRQELSKRLTMVTDFILEESRLADIGSDHAKLPCFAIENGLATFAIAGEVNEGPLRSAERNIRLRGLETSIKAKLGNGLEVLVGEHVDTITVAGMGGPLIARILNEGQQYLNSKVKRLILQPNIAADHIRKWLIENEWTLIAEKILEEDDHVYEILVAERGDGHAAYLNQNVEKALWLGPYLLKQKDDVFKKKWTKELEQLRKVNDQLKIADQTPKLIEKRKEMTQLMNWLEEELR
ncbi:tRNA (adenine(22)-N(1))-methyltransferase [Alteribacter populi]|uniref:tRNA (adenine(22)-N(1))-methyltransferase n=1 Tax=Alteribacter populi TaxID=2011011 RepID=UPI000BBA5A50|nr:tRNA (adenine(22)-N(1))-methyltransferase TrmK [Alteribacter populi]